MQLTREIDGLMSLGHLACIYKGLSGEDIQLALGRKAEEGGYLGDSLVALGKLKSGDIAWLLKKQEALRQGPSIEDALTLLDYTADFTERLFRE